MKVLIDRDKLLTAVSEVKSTTTTKSAIQVLGCVLLEARVSTLRVSATDTEQFHTVPVPANFVSEKGRVAVPAAKLHRILKDGTAKGSELELETDHRNYMTIRMTGEHKVSVVHTVYGVSADSFPLIPVATSESGDQHGIEYEELEKIVDFCLPACSTDPLRFYLQGISMGFSPDDGFMAVATDSRRAHVRFSGGIDKGIDAYELNKCIIPAKVWKSLLPILKRNKTGCTLTISDRRVWFGFGDGSVIGSCLIEGTFPSIRTVMPDIQENIINVDKSILLEGLRAIATMLDKDSPQLRIVRTANEGSLEISTWMGTAGSSRVSVRFNSSRSGEAGQFGVNYRYLLETVKTVKTEDFELCWNQPEAPVTIRQDESDDVILIMPMKLDSLPEAATVEPEAVEPEAAEMIHFDLPDLDLDDFEFEPVPDALVGAVVGEPEVEVEPEPEVEVERTPLEIVATEIREAWASGQANGDNVTLTRAAVRDLLGESLKAVDPANTGDVKTVSALSKVVLIGSSEHVNLNRLHVQRIMHLAA